MSHHLTPIIGTIIYITFPQELRINSKIIYIISIFHNTLLIAFSLWTFISLSKILYDDGFVIEPYYYFKNPGFDNVIYYFYLSKYYEYIDTFLLYLNGKQPILLQKYHHIGAVICWHLCYYYKVDSIWVISWFNSFVHIIMYSYYLDSIVKTNICKCIKQYITKLQLFQLSLQPICLYVYRTENEVNFKINILFTVYITGLLILFSNFYYTNYVNKNL